MLFLSTILFVISLFTIPIHAKITYTGRHCIFGEVNIEGGWRQCANNLEEWERIRTMRWAKKVLPQIDAERKVAKLLAEKPTGPQGNQVKHELIFQKWREAEAKKAKEEEERKKKGKKVERGLGWFGL